MLTILITFVGALLWAGIIVIFKTARGEYRAEEECLAKNAADLARLPSQEQIDAWNAEVERQAIGEEARERLFWRKYDAYIARS